LTSQWYQGTADAIYQNIYTLQVLRPRYVLVLSGDHVYRMDYRRLIEQHVANDADLTIACIETPIREAARLGVISVDVVGRALGFEEKPDVDPSQEANPETALCSMGVYVFKTETLVRRVIEDARDSTSHDFGRDVVPAMIRAGDGVLAFRFVDEHGGAPYWRDIGTLDAYWEAHMDLVGAEPVFDLYGHGWPVRTYAQSAPPFKTVSGNAEPGSPGAEVLNSLVCNGTIIRDGHVSNSIIGRNVRINAGTRIEDSVILDDVCVGRGVTIRRAVIDKGNHIPDDSAVGVDVEQDRTHFTLSERGVVVVPKEMPLFHPPEAQGAGSD
jgi:glucose-1-phosphate adenylyltransferase